MSYTPTEWKNGDTITAEKLNKIEEGIEENQNGYSCEVVHNTLVDEVVITENTEYNYAQGYFSSAYIEEYLIPTLPPNECPTIIGFFIFNDLTNS